MFRNHSLLNHLIVSFIVLIISLGVVFIALFFSTDVFTHPDRYFVENLSPDDFLHIVTLTLSILISALLSAIVYLSLTFRTRTALSVEKTTRWLAISREQFRRLYDSAPIPYLTLNEKGEIREPNKAALRFFEANPQELEGKNIFSFRGTDDKDKGDKLENSFALHIPINNQEIRFVTKGGKTKWVLLSIFDSNTPASKGHTGLASIIDITEQKRLDQAKTEFVSLASHQLRTPLATLKWYTDMLISQDLGELNLKQKEYVDRLIHVNEDMISLVDLLLNVSRIEMGTLHTERLDTNVQKIAEDVIAELTPQIIEKKLQVERSYNTLFEKAHSDPKLLRIVIQNLISNAVKYTPESGTITISFDHTPSERRITVKDTGYGIPKEVQDRIFTKLFRAENVKKLSTSQGTGLGLYLVKSITEALGGTISFISEENKGSAFTITF